MVAALLTLAAPAGADQVEDARAHFKAGVEHFQRGEHEEALARFMAADRAHHDPAITYNIGRAHESLGRAQAALDAYEAYLAEAGAQGELAAAATLAIAEIKGRSSRLRIESTPPGARVRVGETELAAPTPTTVFLFRGKYVVEIAKDDWKETREVDVPGGGSNSDLAVVRSNQVLETPPAAEPRPARAPPVTRASPLEDRGSRPSVERRPELDGLLGTAAFSLSGYTFLGEAEESEQQSETTSDATAKGVVFGLAFDVGWALSTRTALVLRGFGGLGSSKSELAALGAGGPALSYRVADDWWLGAGAIFGGSRADTEATKTEHDPIANVTTEDQSSSITYRTDFAVGPMIELSYSLTQTGDGQWIASLIPGLLLTTSGEQSTLFVPIMIGYRWF